MIIEISFAAIGGLNLGLEKSWGIFTDLLNKYPQARWRKIIDKKHKKCKYVVEIK
ncbi:MAG: hypothetical protein ACP5OG_01900 [Candidatus Nanoarchaeia archaeon]